MTEIPKCRVQRVGKKWRIVLDDSRNVALYTNGEPVDGGGVEDEYIDGKQTTDGQIEAYKILSKFESQHKVIDHEAESIG